jgi:3-hydroxymyristoyl/3-hydroxydecanoyl-(acyl carrier protein) dehydratase
VENNPIKQFIPQREPFIMVSELCSASEKTAHTKLVCSDENIFCTNGFFQEPGIIENIAQTAATLTGYNAVKNKTDVKRGFIGSITNLNIYQLAKCNSEIETLVTVEGQVMNVTLIKGVVKQNQELIAECEMKIFLEE